MLLVVKRKFNYYEKIHSLNHNNPESTYECTAHYT